jgi:hypothetical protein
VTAWPDSANSNDLTTILGAPIFKTNIVNGKPIVRLDGGDDVLEKALLAWQAPITLGVVAKMGVDATVISGGAAKLSLYGTDSATNTIRGGINADLLLAAETMPQTAFRAISAIFANSGSGFWINGVSAGPPADTVGTSDLVESILIALGPADIAEIVVYNNQALGSTDRAALDSYLMAKYGLT